MAGRPYPSVPTLVTLLLLGIPIQAIFPGVCFIQDLSRRTHWPHQARGRQIPPRAHGSSSSLCVRSDAAGSDARLSNTNNKVTTARVAPSLPDGRSTPLSRSDAAEIIETTLFPPSEHGERMGAGKDAQGLNSGSAVRPDDPCMAYTYGEFPLASFDELVDMAVEEQQRARELGTGNGQQKPLNIVDLGSGCGRLVLYAALTRACKVHGIEIGKDLHDVAAMVLERGITAGCFSSASSSSDDTSSCGGEDDEATPIVGLHLGAADALTDVLADADIIFAYSTVFPVSEDWNVDVSAMILGPEWSLMLSEVCRPSCVVITTDRALNPKHGWEIVDRKEVENPEVFGSTGFIHVLHK